MASPFRLNVADLLHRPGARRRERLTGSLGRLEVVDASVPAGSEVVVDTVLDWVSEGVLATGSVTAEWTGDCRRCLAPVSGELRVEFRELFVATPKEGETYPLRGEQIDLAPLAREALLLELPLAPLCAETCLGLCASCGADLNAGACTCPPPDIDARWAALDQLSPGGFDAPGGAPTPPSSERRGPLPRRRP